MTAVLHQQSRMEEFDERSSLLRTIQEVPEGAPRSSSDALLYRRFAQLKHDYRDRLPVLLKLLDALQAVGGGTGLASEPVAEEKEEEDDGCSEPNSETFLAHMQSSASSFAKGVSKKLVGAESAVARKRSHFLRGLFRIAS